MVIRTIAVCLLALALSACGGSQLMHADEQPPPLQPDLVIAAANDPQLAATLDGVIVRDGHGAWAHNADWDEYLLRVRNQSGAALQITQVAVFDSSGHRATPLAERSALVKASRQTARRYKDRGLKVKAGASGLAVAATGTAASVAGTGYAMSTALGATSAGFGASIAMVALTPAAIIGGIVRARRNANVNTRIAARQSHLPLEIPPGQGQALDLFFPLAPAPTRVQITYADAAGEHTLDLDTRDALAGLHLPGQPAAAAADAVSAP